MAVVVADVIVLDGGAATLETVKGCRVALNDFLVEVAEPPTLATLLRHMHLQQMELGSGVSVALSVPLAVVDTFLSELDNDASLSICVCTEAIVFLLLPRRGESASPSALRRAS